MATECCERCGQWHDIIKQECIPRFCPVRPRKRKKATVHYDIHLESKLEKNMLMKALGLLEQRLIQDFQVEMQATPNQYKHKREYAQNQRWNTLQNLHIRIQKSKGHVLKEK